MLKDFVDLIEGLAAQEFETHPNAMFMVDLRNQLVAQLEPVYPEQCRRWAETICSNADVSLSKYEAKDPLWQRFMAAYPKVVIRGMQGLKASGFSETAIEIFIQKLSLKLDF